MFLRCCLIDGQSLQFVQKYRIRRHFPEQLIVAPRFSEDTLLRSRQKSSDEARHQLNHGRRNQYLHHDISVSIPEYFWTDKVPELFQWISQLTVNQKRTVLH